MVTPILPTPKKCVVNNEVTKLLSPVIRSAVGEWGECADAFCAAVDSIFELRVEHGDGGVILERDEALAPGAYRLKCDGTACVYASDLPGVSHGLASLLQLISVKDGAMYLPLASVEDHADKPFGAFMVAPGQVWHSLRTLFRLVDLCFLFKIPYLHIHLVDNGLYALESKAFPKLNKPGKFYTAEEMASLNRYAAARGVGLIPEFEGPGHARIFTREYPELFANHICDSEGKPLVTENGDVIGDDDLLCVGNPAGRDAIRTLLGEMCAAFPDSAYVHIGGDEASDKLWNDCPVCRKYMADHGLADVGELYSEYIGFAANVCLENGKTPIVWEGFPRSGARFVPKETVVIAWESYYNFADDLLEDGYRIINASWQPLYIVPDVKKHWDALDIMRWDVYNWQHWYPESRAYLNPLHVTPTDRVLGAEICSWGMTYEQEIGLAMENLSALSERLWNVKRLHDDDDFLRAHVPLMRLASKLIAEKS